MSTIGHFRQSLLWATIWLLLCVLGFAYISGYDVTPGKGIAPGGRFAGHKNTLTVFVHPLCPCTDATLIQLEKLLTQYSGLSADIYFVKHRDLNYKIENTRLWQQAKLLPRTHLMVDPAGKLASSMKIATSGQAILTDQQGRIIFSGGITGARGHIGDNLGSAAVCRLIHDPNFPSASAAVFGCPLFN